MHLYVYQKKRWVLYADHYALKKQVTVNTNKQETVKTVKIYSLQL